MTKFAGLFKAEGVNMKLILPARSQNRRGLGRIDVIVLIAVCVLLWAVVGPGLLQKRRPARLMACMNNLRQVWLATLNYSTNYNGDLPFLSSDVEITNAAGQKGTIPMSWQMQLLPMIRSKSTRLNSSH